MAVDVAARFTRARARPLARVRSARWPQLALVAVVGVSAAVRSLLALLHSTAYYFPDEYLYPALARSLATTGRPLVRGGDAHFPALLQPLLTAPFQAFDDPELAFRLTQLFGAAAMSTAAIPVYLLARRLGLGEWFAVACGGLAVAAPSLVYSGFMLADPVAYPLALTAVYLGVRALDSPTRRAQLAFLGSAGAATFARTQYVILPLAFALAALVLDRRRALSRYRVTIALLGACVLGTVALGPSRIAGVYSSLGDGLDLGAALAWAGRDVVLLAYSAGWVLVPGACVGLLVARARIERAFAWFCGFLAGGLVVEAGLIAAADADRFQERYLMALVPLVPVAFGLYVRRGAPLRKLVAAVAVALLVFSARVPLSGYAAARGKDDSVFLKAVRELGVLVGVADGALLVAACAGVLSLVALALPYRRRTGVVLGVALTALAFGAVSTGTYAYDRDLARFVRSEWLPEGARWVDEAGVRDAALLMLPNSEPQRSWNQLLWNRSVTDVLLLGGRERLDGYASSRVRVAADGRIVARGLTVRRPLLVQTHGSRATFFEATKVESTPDFDLWRPHGIPRLSLLAEGWYMDGWIAWPGIVTIWPDATGWVRGSLRLRVDVPRGFPRTPVTLTAPGFSRTVVLRPNAAATIRVLVEHPGRWKLELSTPRAAMVGLRAVSVRGLEPSFQRRRGHAGAGATLAYTS